jgi:hypothetical protein
MTTGRVGTNVGRQRFVLAGWFVVEAFWRASILEIFDDPIAALLTEEWEERRNASHVRRTGTAASRDEHLM